MRSALNLVELEISKTRKTIRSDYMMLVVTLCEGVEDAEERAEHPSIGKIINQVHPGTTG